MNEQNLRILLEKTDDKFGVLSSSETLNKYNITIAEYLDFISNFLNDEEKLRLLEIMKFKIWIKSGIISLVSDENILLQILNNDTIMNGFEKYQIIDIIIKMNDSTKKQILRNQEFVEKHKIVDYELNKIISSLSDGAKIEILQDKDLIQNSLHLKDYKIAELVKGISSDDEKQAMLELYELKNYLKINIINTLHNDIKLNILLKNDDFNKNDRIGILKSFDIETLSEFLKHNRAFLSKSDINPYEIICKLDTEQQKDFITKLEDINLTLGEKREILAMLKEEVKQSVDTSNFPEEYKSAISIQTNEYDGINRIDFGRKIEDYRGLDKLMRINPEKFTEEQRTKFRKLCDICPNLHVVSTLDDNSVEFSSTASEYKETEEWIESIIDKLKPEYTKAQKMAVIDNEIGKKISYSPDFDTEIFNINNCRALWKIIKSGYGVCNGIARLEQYIFNRVGIKSELISSGTHSFLKIKEIELPLANGEIARGNTILDPTWNLASNRFGGKPDNFCISYERARKNDIDAEGKDHKSHKNDEELKDATLDLDEQSLRELFKSVGLADRDGQFPIKDLLEKSKLLDDIYANQPDKNISKQFLLLKQTCPEFATCQNSSMRILSGVLLCNDNMRFNKCVVSRVYDRKDNEKNPVLYVYIDSNELGQKFYFANNYDGFSELLQEDFIEKFECYEKDLNKYNRS